MSMKERTWYRMEADAKDPSAIDVQIVDFIGDWIDDYWGFGVTAKAFISQISSLDAAVKAIRVHINSPGGDVFAAVNIANALRDQQTTKGRTVETIVDGLAASAATIIMMAGSKVSIADNGMVMVHNPSSIALGQAKDMRKTADDLDAIRNTIVATYKWHSTLADADLVALMDAETWMDADEAIANGFATAKIEGLKATAAFDSGSLDKLRVPERFKARVQALQKPAAKAEETPRPLAEADVLRLCEEGGCDLPFARTLVSAKATEAEVKTRINNEKTRRTEAKRRGDAITALCTTHKVPQLAAGYIDGGMSLEAVKAHLTTITALVEKGEIDGGLHPNHDQHQVDASWKKSMVRAGRSRGR